MGEEEVSGRGRDWVGVHGGEGRVDRTSKGRVEYKVGK